MKYYCFFLMLCHAFSNTEAQHLNRASQSGNEKASGLFAINSKHYYFRHITLYGCCSSGPVMMSAASGGPQKSTISHYFGQELFDFQTFNTSDDHFLIFGFSVDGCDLLGPKFMIKVDTLGAVIFNKNYPVTGLLSGFAASPDSSFYTIENGIVVHYFKSGDKETSINLGVTNINAIGLMQNGNLIVCHGSNKIRQTTSTGILISEVSCPNAVRKIIQLAPTEIVAIGNNALQKYSINTGLLKTSSPVIPASYTVTDFATRNDTLFVTGFTPQSEAFYYIMDSDLDLLYHTVSNCNGLYPTGISINQKNMIGIIANGNNGSGMLSTNYFMLPLKGAIEARADVGVQSFKVNSATWNTHFKYGIVNANVVVRNFGDDTVKTFRLIHQAKVTYQCDFSLNKEYTLAIPPGVTVEVNTGEFYVNSSDTLPNSHDAVPKVICLFTSIPDSGTDQDYTNDKACNTVTLMKVGLPDELVSVNNIEIFPNPGIGGVFVKASVEITRASLFDLTGRVLRVIEPMSESFEVQNEIPGIYFLKIESVNATIFRKIIIK